MAKEKKAEADVIGEEFRSEQSRAEQSRSDQIR